MQSACCMDTPTASRRSAIRSESASDTILSTEAPLATSRLTSHRVDYTKEDIRQLKALLKAKAPMGDIGKAMGRTAAGVRMKARTLGILPKRKSKTAGRRAGP